MKTLIAMFGEKAVNAFMLAQMNGVDLSMNGFKDFLGNVKEMRLKDAKAVIESLYSFMDSQPIMDFQFVKFDIPWLTVLVDKLEEEIKKDGEIRMDLLLQEEALCAWVDYVLFCNDLPANRFGFNEAKAVYNEYRDRRDSMGQSIAA